MEKIIEITLIEDSGVIHFTYLGEDNKRESEVSIVDINTGLIVHKTNINLIKSTSWWISTGENNARKLRNVKLLFNIDGNVHEELIRFNGENRFLVVNTKKVNLDHNGDSLFPIVCEIFYEKIYERDFVKIEHGDTIVDIGANYGVFSLYSQQFSPKNVYSVEPIKSTFKKLTKNLKPYKVKCINKAISNENGFESFAVTDVNGNNFSIKNSDGYHPSTMLSQEIVETTTINSLINDYNIEKIDFLKVDCEGGELDLFETIDKEFLSKSVKKTAIEYHSNLIKNRVIEILESNNFTIEDVSGFYDIGLIYAYNNFYYGK
jgi:FkbM family methyltransferase